MAAGSHFGCPIITLYRISYHFRSIPQFLFLFKFFSKMAAGHFRFLAISDQYTIFFVYKMAAVGHFGCPKFTLDHISGYFRSIQIFYFFTKWLPVAILDIRKSLSISFLAISDRYTTFNFFEIFDKMATVSHFGCPKFTLDHISGHFRSIQIFFYKMAAGGHFGCPKITFDLISIHFTSIRNLNFFEIFYKMAQVGHFGFPKFTFDRNSGHFRSIQNYLFSGGHFGSHFWPFQIDRPFWMSEIHFRWHFWPFQIHKEFFF